MTETPACPVCGAPTTRRLAQRGSRAGLEFWGCTRWPSCSGVINIEPADPASRAVSKAEAPAAYAQRQHLREVERSRLKRRAALPLMVAVGLLGMTIAFFSLQPLGVTLASGGAVVVGFVIVFGLFRMPFDSLIWTKGVEGERKTAEYLEPLLSDDYVALYNRLVDGHTGDIDCLLIGPTGVYAIETKNWSGRSTVRNNRLFVGEGDRDWAIERLARAAIAVQIALGDEMNAQALTVTPVLCLINGVSPADASAVGVHVRDAARLTDFVRSRPRILDVDAVRSIAKVAERQLRQQYVWDLV